MPLYFGLVGILALVVLCVWGISTMDQDLIGY